MRSDHAATLALVLVVSLVAVAEAAAQPADQTRLVAPDTVTTAAASLVTVRGADPEELAVEYRGPEGTERTTPDSEGRAWVPWTLVTGGRPANGRLRVLGPDSAARAEQAVRVEPGGTARLQVDREGWSPVRSPGGTLRLRGDGLDAGLEARLVVQRPPEPGLDARDGAGERWTADCDLLAAGGREAVLAVPDEVPVGRRARLVLSNGERRRQLRLQLYRLRLEAPRTRIEEGERVSIAGMLTAVTPLEGRLQLTNATPEVVRMRLEPTGTNVSPHGGLLAHTRKGTGGGWEGSIQAGERFAFTVAVVGRSGSPPGTPFRIDYTLSPARSWVQAAYPGHVNDIQTRQIEVRRPGPAGRARPDDPGAEQPQREDRQDDARQADEQNDATSGAVFEAGDLTIRMSGAVADWAGERRRKLEAKVRKAQNRARNAQAKVQKLKKRLQTLRQQRQQARKQARKHAAEAKRWKRVADDIVQTDTYGEIVDRLGPKEARRRVIEPNRQNATQARQRARKARKRTDRLGGEIQKLNRKLRQARKKARKARQQAEAAEKHAKQAVQRCRAEVRQRREAQRDACREARAEVRRLQGQIEGLKATVDAIRQEIERRRKQLRRMARERSGVLDGMLEPMQKLFDVLSTLDSKLGKLSELTTLLLGSGVWESPDPTNALTYGKEALEAIEELYRHYTDPEKTGSPQRGDFLQRTNHESPQMVKAALQKHIRNLRNAMQRLNRLAGELEDARERLRSLDCPPPEQGATTGRGGPARAGPSVRHRGRTAASPRAFVAIRRAAIP